MKKLIICMSFMLIIGCSSSTTKSKDMTIYGYKATVFSLLERKNKELSDGLISSYSLGLYELDLIEEDFKEFVNSYQSSGGRHIQITEETRIYRKSGNVKVPIDATELANESEVELWLYAYPEDTFWVVASEVILLQAGSKLDD